MQEDVKMLRTAVAEIAYRIGIPSVHLDWDGCDAVWPVLDKMAGEGAVVVVKMDGQRTQEGDNGKYTVIISGGPLKEDFFRTDTTTLQEGIAKAILYYAKKCWP